MPRCRGEERNWDVRLVFLAVAVAAGLAGCSGDGGPEDCQTRIQQFQACGGDLSDDWTILQACVGEITPTHILFSACPSATLTGTMDSAGSMQIGPDYLRPTFARQIFSFHLEVPISCLTPLALSCTYVEQEINSDPETTGACVEQGDQCICDADQDLIDEWTGWMPLSYLPNDRVLVIAPDGAEYRIPFCIEKDRARMEIEFITSQGSAMVYFFLKR